ncbi:Uncharacterized protein YggT [Candidatus Erwinia haradaeae]|uniref:Uncharacterized protein YggT n=1 Tax=Candidatus Erwinia haradaeae TaxID=1922217 RepID=A0A451DDL2_9GAMM|nr:YggT family protein [Candidatus Erwinia haradaeae]VFP84573.1 Uncharacterized protein YggT [Candidatus Erwinia haradaeae]
MLALIFLVTTIMTLYIKILLLHTWMQLSRCDFYNSFVQLIMKITYPIVNPFRRILKYNGPWDIVSVFISYVISVLMVPIMLKLVHFDLILFYLGLVILLKSFGVLVFWVIIGRSLTSWVNQGSNAVDEILLQLTEPLMIPIRRVVPPTSGLDFSVMIVIGILYILNFIGIEYIPGWAHL